MLGRVSACKGVPKPGVRVGGNFPRMKKESPEKQFELRNGHKLSLRVRLGDILSWLAEMIVEIKRFNQ